MKPFEENKFSTLPAPIEIPFFDGTLTASNAAALSANKIGLGHLKTRIATDLLSPNQDLRNRAVVAAYIFDPSLLPADIVVPHVATLNAFLKRMNAAFLPTTL